MNDNFNEFQQNNETHGSISGFDSAEDNLENPVEEKYEDSGVYTKSRDEIIQDNASVSNDDKTYSNFSGDNSSTSNVCDNSVNNDTFGYQASQYNYYKEPVKKEPKQKKRYGAFTVIIAAVLAAVIGAAGGIFTLLYFENPLPLSSYVDDNEYKGNNSNVNINIDKSVESVVEAVAEKVSPSVVGIRTTTSVMSFFGGSSESTGEGSGVIYKSNGYIITNYHVIESVIESSNGKIEVFLNGSTEKSYEAKVIGYHISSDLAVIKIDATNLPAVTIADSDNLKAGQYVIAIGNPGGLEFMGSVTYGVISGLNRVVSTSSGITLIQTDAAINPGNSGGALLNTKGELIGINSSKIVSEEYEGMGFAIPSNTAVEKCERIINRKDVAEPYVGITISERYTAEVLNYYGYPVGAVVLSVDKDSPAYNTGIRKGDIITEFNGRKITNYNLFEEILHDLEPNSSVKIKIYRSGKYYSADLKIATNGATSR